MYQQFNRAPVSRRRMLHMGLAATVAVGVPAVLTAPASSASPGHGSPTEQLDQTLSAIVTGLDEPATLPVAATGLLTGAVSWRGAAGYADRDRRQLARREVDYHFRIGSVAKSFLATMVLQLVGEGRLGLDDPVGRHLPAVVPGDDRITVRHLLGMTSGLTDFMSILFAQLRPGNVLHREFVEAMSKPISPLELVAMAVRAGPRFEPGQNWQYCTTNYVVLGLMLERLTGHGYLEELHRRILVPLRLRDTYLPDRPWLQPPHLHGYTHFDDRTEEWTDVSSRYEPGWAGGSLVSTMADLSRFFTALAAGRLLSRDLLTEMRTPIGAPPPVNGAPDGRNYGLGLRRYDHPTRRDLWGHGGRTHGYSCQALSTSDGRQGIVVYHTGFPLRQDAPSGDPAATFLDAAIKATSPAH